MENKTLKIILSLVVVVVCVYFIATSAWFKLDTNPCPDGTRQVVTVWNEGTPTERTDKICAPGEE